MAAAAVGVVVQGTLLPLPGGVQTLAARGFVPAVVCAAAVLASGHLEPCAALGVRFP